MLIMWRWTSHQTSPWSGGGSSPTCTTTQTWRLLISTHSACVHLCIYWAVLWGGGVGAIIHGYCLLVAANALYPALYPITNKTIMII